MAFESRLSITTFVYVYRESVSVSHVIELATCWWKMVNWKGLWQAYKIRALLKSIEETWYDERIVQLAFTWQTNGSNTSFHWHSTHFNWFTLNFKRLVLQCEQNVNTHRQRSILMNFAQIHTSIKLHRDTIKLTTWFMFWLKFLLAPNIQVNRLLSIITGIDLKKIRTWIFEFLAICSFGFLFVCILFFAEFLCENNPVFSKLIRTKCSF